MRRLLLLIVVALGASACGSDIGIPTPGNGVGREGWYSIHDDTTGRSFRCFYWSLSESTAFWCYEPQQTGAGNG